MARNALRAAATGATILTLCQPLASKAQDASFPCKVLLCGAATNPSWPAIPYCVPIMQQAIAMAALGVAVGVCAEALQGGGSSGSQPAAPYGATPSAAGSSTPDKSTRDGEGQATAQP